MTMPRFATVDEFERWYAEGADVTVELLHSRGLYGKPCDCGKAGCGGWQMGYEEQEEKP